MSRYAGNAHEDQQVTVQEEINGTGCAPLWEKNIFPVSFCCCCCFWRPVVKVSYKRNVSRLWGFHPLIITAVNVTTITQPLSHANSHASAKPLSSLSCIDRETRISSSSRAAADISHAEQR